ncbi:restriction endonuclease [Nocardia sp. BMG111209]|uniref:restriction endonuclease n=1 Tax=Nocardia sp. BMG111209 TaxID=1160137 RepID=UPI0003A9D59A|nr:restriction endonuclease [Nocardia sp. BMG111209]
MGRRRRRRTSNTLGLLIMAAAAATVLVPRAVHAAAAEAHILITVAVCLLTAVVVAVILRAWYRFRARAREDARTLAALRQNALTPREFEEALAALCRRDGCTEVRVVGGAGDLGADVIARAPDGRRIVLQAKRYRNGRAVGSQDVQRFGGTAHTIHRADIAAVVTTAQTFTAQAQDYADRAGIRLVAAKALAAWDTRTGPPPWD